MKLIDCSCQIGYSCVNHNIVNHENFTLCEKVSEAKNADEMIAYMDYCGIAQALVGHQSMRELSPERGNETVVKETTKYPERLLPTWAILPPVTDEYFVPENLIAEMKRNQVRVLRAYPQVNRYFLDGITMGDLLEVIVMKKIPLILSPEYGYKYIFNLLKEFPGVRVIVNNYGPWSSLRFWYPLLRAYKNVYFEIGDLETDGALEEMVGKFGSGQILFGSEFPVNNMGGAIGVLTLAGISLEDKDNIAHANIERLLAEVEL